MSRAALITGGAQGVGAAIAARLLAEGFQVVITDVNEGRLAQETAALSKLGRVEAMVGDLRDDATPRRAVQFCADKFGSLDVLVNAAGDVSRASIEDASLDTYYRLFDINVKAPLFLMQEAAKIMKMQKSGTIINVASMIAQGGPPNLAIYGATKAALVQLTKHAAHVWAWEGIRAFCINLGWAFTEGEQRTQTKVHHMPENWGELIGAQTPAGRLILPSDIADLAAYLISPSAQMMNGTVIDFEQLPAGVFRTHPILKS